MAYIGNTPAESYASFERQVFTIVNSQTAYTLNHTVTNENEIRLVVNNVVQEPGSGKAFTASGTTLTLSAALVNGTDEMYCVFLGRALQTVNPPSGSVGLSQLSATGTKSSSTFLRGDNTFAAPSGESGPAFYAKATEGNTSFTSSTVVKIPFTQEQFDTDNCYDPTTNYRFTPTKAGYYLITVAAEARSNTSTSGSNSVYLYKNGSSIAVFGSTADDPIHTTLTHIVSANGSSDYFEGYIYSNMTSPFLNETTDGDCRFEGVWLRGL